MPAWYTKNGEMRGSGLFLASINSNPQVKTVILTDWRTRVYQIDRFKLKLYILCLFVAETNRLYEQVFKASWITMFALQNSLMSKKLWPLALLGFKKLWAVSFYLLHFLNRTKSTVAPFVYQILLNALFQPSYIWMRSRSMNWMGEEVILALNYHSKHWCCLEAQKTNMSYYPSLGKFSKQPDFRIGSNKELYAILTGQQMVQWVRWLWTRIIIIAREMAKF